MIVLFPGCICHLSLSLNNPHWKTSKGLLPVEEQRKWEPCENVFCPPTTSGSSRREFLSERWVVGIRYSPGAKRREKWGKPSVSSGSRNSSGSLRASKRLTIPKYSISRWRICLLMYDLSVPGGALKQVCLIFSLLGGILLSISRHYRSQPTHGIGRYKHLVKAQEVKGAGVL